MAPLGVRVHLDREDSGNDGKSKVSAKLSIIVPTALLAVVMSTPLSISIMGIFSTPDDSLEMMEEVIAQHDATLRSLVSRIAELTQEMNEIPHAPEE